MLKSAVKAAAVGLLLAGCAQDSNNKGSKGVSEEGLCTSATIFAFNEVGSKAQLYATSKDPAYLTGVQTACKEFKDLIGSKSCKAKDLKTGLSTTVSYEDRKAICDLAAGNATSNTSNTSTASEKPVTRSANPIDRSTAETPEDGACSAADVSAIQDLRTRVRIFQISNKESDVDLAIQSCDVLKERFADDRSCKVMNTSSGRTVEFSSKDFSEACTSLDDLKKLMAESSN